MLRSLMGGVAVLALIAGTAYAQDSNSTYYSRTITQTSPFGASRSTTTTTTRSEAPMADGDDVDADVPPPMAAVPPPPPPPGYDRGYDEQSADIGPAPPPPGAVGPGSEETTTTRRYDPDGSETHTYQRRQTYYDGDGQLSARTTTQTRSHVMGYGPPVVYAPTQDAAGPSPSLDLPPRQYNTTTTTVTHDEE